VTELREVSQTASSVRTVTFWPSVTAARIQRAGRDGCQWEGWQQRGWRPGRDGRVPLWVQLNYEM